jgi:hypothetical protein
MRYDDAFRLLTALYPEHPDRTAEGARLFGRLVDGAPIGPLEREAAAAFNAPAPPASVTPVSPIPPTLRNDGAPEGA